MARLQFEQLRFQPRDGSLRIIFLKHYYFDIPAREAEECGVHSAHGNCIDFSHISERKARKQVIDWLELHQQSLINSLNGKSLI